MEAPWVGALPALAGHFSWPAVVHPLGMWVPQGLASMEIAFTRMPLPCSTLACLNGVRHPTRSPYANFCSSPVVLYTAQLSAKSL